MVEDLGLRLPTLPQGIIRILNREFRGTVRFALQESVIQRCKLAPKKFIGPIIESDAMCYDDQRMVIFSKSDQDSSQHWVTGEVDGQFCKPTDYALQLVFLRFSRRFLKFDDFEIYGWLSIDPLYQTSFIRRSEVCSEDLVSLD